MGFNISLPKLNLPKINLPKFQVPKIHLPKPPQVFGMFKGNNLPKLQPRAAAQKPNIFQRATNFGKSFIKNPVAATQRLQQKVNHKVANTARYIKNGTVSNTKKAINKVGTQFTRFENWADKGIKNNHKWSQQNRNSNNLLNKVTANANLAFTKVAKFGNNRINEASSYYRGLRKSDNWLKKSVGYVGGGFTSLGRGLASPVTFADPRLSGKQRTGQVVDGALSYVPVGKVFGVGGKLLKPVTGQIAKRAPWLIKGGSKVIAKSQKIINKVSQTKVGNLLTKKVINPTKNGLSKLNNGLNRNITPKGLRGTENNLRNTLTQINNLPNKVLGKHNNGVSNITKQVADGNKKKSLRDFQGSNLEDTLRKNKIKSTFNAEQTKFLKKNNVQMNAHRFEPHAEPPHSSISRKDFTKRLNPVNQTPSGPFPNASPKLEVTDSTRASLERMFSGNSAHPNLPSTTPNLSPVNPTFELRFPVKGKVNGQEQTLNYVFNANRIEHYVTPNGGKGVKFISPNTYPINSAGRPIGIGADVKGSVNIGNKETLKAQRELMSYLRDQGFSEVWFTNITRVEGGGVKNLSTGSRPDVVYNLGN